MKTINIIKSLHLSKDGVVARTRNGKHQSVHLRQGDLDGACAIYSTVMALIILGLIKYSDVRLGAKSKDKRTMVERLKKLLFEEQGLHREGHEFDEIKQMLKKSYSRFVSVDDPIEGPDITIIEEIKNQIVADNPVIISYEFSGGAHALVAIGIESEGSEVTKILCLDPGYPTPKFTYWNSVIDLEEFTGKYKYRNFTETGVCNPIKLGEILVLSKK